MPHHPPASRTRALTGLDPTALVRLGIVRQESGPLVVPGYEILESLGRGGMGEVFRARQESLGREVAVKILRADLPATGWLPERFEQEARTMAALRHPNVVTVHDSVRLDDGRVVIVMEFISGGSLRSRLVAAPDGLPLPQALRWAREIAEGLRAAHHAGLIHRDVKPDNVLIDETDTARVSDFGLACSGSEPASRFTQTGAAPGTPGYMAPEITRGEPVDARADIFGFGAMLYEMLTGRPPQGSFPPPRQLRPGVPPALDRAIVAALRPDPALRPRDMAAMLRALHSGTGIFTRRRALIAGSAAGLAVAGYWLTRPNSKPKPPAPVEPVAGENWLRLPWPDEPAAIAIRGGWTRTAGSLISDDQICILPVTGIPPKSCKIRLRFRRVSGEHSIGVFFRTARGTAVCTLDGRGKHLGGVQAVGSLSLEESGGFVLALENGRDYECTVEIRPERVRMWVDGVLREDRSIAGETLTVPATWDWVPPARSAAVHLGSWNSPTQFHSLDWLPLE